MSFLDSIKKGLFDQEDDYEDQYIDDGPQMVNNNNGVGLGADDEAEEHTEGTNKKNGKVVNINATTQLKVVLVKPERFEDASTIADHLNNKRTVVLNLEDTNKEAARRILDFLTGVAYSIGGNIKKVANSAYVVTPSNGDVSERQIKQKAAAAKTEPEAAE